MTVPQLGSLESRDRMAARLWTGTAGPERRLAEFAEVDGLRAASA